MKSEAYYKKEAQEFVDKHPDYVVNPENRNALFARLIEKKLDLNRKNLSTVYEELKAEGKLKLRGNHEKKSEVPTPDSP